MAMRLPHAGKRDETGLLAFSAALDRFTFYSGWQELSSLTYGEKTAPCNIVSSIEFDRDGEVFAVAGVTKKIKVIPSHSCFIYHHIICFYLYCHIVFYNRIIGFYIVGHVILYIIPYGRICYIVYTTIW